jgi:hypothetical protein
MAATVEQEVEMGFFRAIADEAAKMAKSPKFTKLGDNGRDGLLTVDFLDWFFSLKDDYPTVYRVIMSLIANKRARVQKNRPPEVRMIAALVGLGMIISARSQNASAIRTIFGFLFFLNGTPPDTFAILSKLGVCCTRGTVIRELDQRSEGIRVKDVIPEGCVLLYAWDNMNFERFRKYFRGKGRYGTINVTVRLLLFLEELGDAPSKADDKNLQPVLEGGRKNLDVCDVLNSDEDNARLEMLFFSEMQDNLVTMSDPKTGTLEALGTGGAYRGLLSTIAALKRSVLPKMKKVAVGSIRHVVVPYAPEDSGTYIGVSNVEDLFVEETGKSADDPEPRNSKVIQVGDNLSTRFSVAVETKRRYDKSAQRLRIFHNAPGLLHVYWDHLRDVVFGLFWDPILGGLQSSVPLSRRRVKKGCKHLTQSSKYLQLCLRATLLSALSAFTVQRDPSIPITWTSFADFLNRPVNDGAYMTWAGFLRYGYQYGMWRRAVRYNDGDTIMLLLKALAPISKYLGKGNVAKDLTEHIVNMLSDWCPWIIFYINKYRCFRRTTNGSAIAIDHLVETYVGILKRALRHSNLSHESMQRISKNLTMLRELLRKLKSTLGVGRGARKSRVADHSVDTIKLFKRIEEVEPFRSVEGRGYASLFDPDCEVPEKHRMDGFEDRVEATYESYVEAFVRPPRNAVLDELMQRGADVAGGVADDVRADTGGAVADCADTDASDTDEGPDGDTTADPPVDAVEDEAGDVDATTAEPSHWDAEDELDAEGLDELDLTATRS